MTERGVLTSPHPAAVRAPTRERIHHAIKRGCLGEPSRPAQVDHADDAAHPLAVPDDDHRVEWGV